MLAAAEKMLNDSKAMASQTIHVTGAYEMPLMVDQLLARSTINGVVVLGFIEQGETKHGEVMGQVVHQALIELELKHGKPIGKGIIGPGSTASQAEVRQLPVARQAVRAVLQSLETLAKLASSRPKNPA